MGRTTRFPPCALADLGRCSAPCDDRIDLERYEGLVRSLQHALSSPGELLAALEARMERLAAQERFEEAAESRDRMDAVVGALDRVRNERWLIDAGRLEMDVDGHRLRFRSGALVRRGDESGYSLPVPLDAADEVRAALSALRSADVRVVAADHAPAESVTAGTALARVRRRLDAARR
jgi:hypothetical protein